MMNAVELADVSVQFRRGGGLSGISFTAAPGEWISVFGDSGCGKTTLLRVLTGRLLPDTGAVWIYGRSPRSAHRRMGIALEDAPVNSLFSPNQFLSQCLARHNISGAQRAARMAEVLDLCGLYADRDRPARELSRGQQTALAVAAALAHRPAVLLLDNVTSSLPMPIVERLREHLNDLRALRNLCVIQTTVHSEEAERADRVLILDRGYLLACASPGELQRHYSSERIVVEAADPRTVQKTLRGIYDLEITETRDGLRFSAIDGLATAASLFRHPAGGVRTVYLRRPTLWEVLEALRKHAAR
jgi:ABC-type multidrug transport system ATPase subunit